MKHYLFIGCGGFLGAIARAVMSQWIDVRLSHHPSGNYFPFGTLYVNTIGSFFITLIIALTARHTTWGPFLLVGFLGSFTTFSTFSMQTLQQLQHQQYLLATINVVANILLSLLMAYIGFRIGTTLRP